MMKNHKNLIIAFILGILSLTMLRGTALSSDTCMFAVTSDEVPPNIVLLIDNGVEMKHPVFHDGYRHQVDYTPQPVGDQQDIVAGLGTGNGFYNEYGYSIFITGGKHYLVPVDETLQPLSDVRLEGLVAAEKKSSIFTINEVTVELPAFASAEVDGDGIKDNAGDFHYSKNYLNWLFYYETAADLDGDGTVEPLYDDAALPDKSRFYYAKKALLDVGRLSSNKAKFAIYNFTSAAEGASSVQPLSDVVTQLGATLDQNVLDPNYINNINNMGTVIYSPLAEGLAVIGGYLDSNSSGSIGSDNYCQKNFVIVVTPGYSSEDISDSNQSIPSALEDYDADGNDVPDGSGAGQGKLTVDSVDYFITPRINGSTYLDDVAHYFYTHDMRVSNDTVGGFQNISVYTVGFMAMLENTYMLINTSNNGNGFPNLTDSADPNYGKFHFEAESANGLSQAILNAVNDIISATSSFTAPVVPVTRTTSGSSIYIAFFKPVEGNFWDGNVTKYGLDEDNAIIDKNDKPATWPNGAMIEDSEPFWATKDWADIAKDNGILNSSRNIYTYLGANPDLTSTDNEFSTSNNDLTALMLGNPTDISVDTITVLGREKVINYIRGADVLDEDGDGVILENRAVITGDVLHSEPLVVTYYHPDNSAETLVFFGANDGMLHAVKDEYDPDVETNNDEITYGTEAWAFIPPDQLNRLKLILEGFSHVDFVDSSPKSYFYDVNHDGIVDPNAGDQIILVCGERKGGSSYFALDITRPYHPLYLWRIGRANDSEIGTVTLEDIVRNAAGLFNAGDALTLLDGSGQWNNAALVSLNEYGSVSVDYDSRTIPFEVGQQVGNLTTAMYDQYIEYTQGQNSAPAPFVYGRIASITNTDPDVIIAEMGESWSEPQFGIVKTSENDSGTKAMFIGGGYSADNSVGNAVLVVNLVTGQLIQKFTEITAQTTDVDKTIDTPMNYSVVSTVKVIDENYNGIIDKIYVGDLGGRMWRFGQFSTSVGGDSLTFPDSEEVISEWIGQVLFTAPTYTSGAETHTRKFFYPPSVSFEKGYDLVFMGTGNRELACSTATAADRIYCVKDTHSAAVTLTETDLVDVTAESASAPNLNQINGDVDSNSAYDQGWYIRLVDSNGDPTGEKVLAEGTVFYKTLYITTFAPNSDPCVPGGESRIYALNYLTGASVLDFGQDHDGDGLLDLTRNYTLGGGIPSKPVTVITSRGQKLFISVGSTNPDIASQSTEAGIIRVSPFSPKRNFFYIWWRESIN